MCHVARISQDLRRRAEKRVRVRGRNRQSLLGLGCHSVARMTEPASTGAKPALSSREVSDYLAQWGVEDAVKQAINSAIRHKAADPVLHIAEILEQKGREAEAARAAAGATAPSSADNGG